MVYTYVYPNPIPFFPIVNSAESMRKWKKSDEAKVGEVGEAIKTFVCLCEWVRVGEKERETERQMEGKICFAKRPWKYIIHIVYIAYITHTMHIIYIYIEYLIYMEYSPICNEKSFSLSLSLSISISSSADISKRYGQKRAYIN